MFLRTTVTNQTEAMKRLIQGFVFGSILLLLPGLAWAQQGTITGTITEAETGSALPGATVQVPDEGTGAAADSDGQYRITGVPAGEQTVRVTFVGYQSTERTINVPAGGTVRANFQLQSTASELGEVVVTGLAQEQTRAEASVSVTSIDAADLADDADFQSVESLFQGSTPGVTVSQTSGNIGAGIRFKVRGGVSLNSDGQPVIYIDGTRVDQNVTNGRGAGGQEVSPLADLNPNEIESIEVLKGPSAAALYGTDGADGVVLIETKQGDIGQDLEVDYGVTLGYNEKERDWPDDRFKSVDAIEGTFREGDIQQHQVSATGSFRDANYYVSYTNRVSEGIQRGNDGERNNLRANFEVNPTDEVRISASSGFTTNELTRPQNDNNTIGQIGNTVLAFRGTPYFFTDSTDVFAVEDKFRIQRFQGSLDGSYSPNAVPGLQLSVSAGADVTSRRENQTFPSSGTYDGITDGERGIYEENIRQFNGDLTASYNYTLIPDLSATSTVGTQAFTRSFESAELAAQQFGSDAITDIESGAQIQTVQEDIFNRRSLGHFARQSFTYQSTYSLSASVRRDLSTQIAPGGNSAFSAWYPSLQGNVRFSQFDAVPDFVTQLKLRGSFGQSGALPSPTSVQELRLVGSASGFGTGAVVGSVGDPDLNAETVSEYEVGLDLEFNGRYSLSTTYYTQETEDSIVDFDPAPSTGLGFEDRPVNVGRIAGQGIETSVNAVALETDRHRVSVGANHTWQTSEVQDIDGQILRGTFDRNRVQEGFAPRAFIGAEVDGAQFTDDGAYAGINVVDQNDDGEINSDDDVKLGEPRPDHFGGFNLRAQLFDHFTISGRAEYQLDRQVFNNTQNFTIQFGNDPRIDRLSGQLFPDTDPVEGTEQLEPGTDAYRQAANKFAELNTAFRDDVFAPFVQDAGFFKLREIAIAYDFSSVINNISTGSSLVRSFRLRLSGQNLYTVTPYELPAVQVSSTGARGISTNQDFLTMPQPRSFTASLNIGF